MKAPLASLFPALLAGLLPALAAAGSAGPSIRFFAPLDGEQVLERTRVVVELEGFTPACSALGTANQEGSLRWVLEVDGEDDSSNCSPWGGIFKQSGTGHHVLRAYLVESDGTAISPPVEAIAGVDVTTLPLDPTFVLPAVAHAPGADGAFFRTELWLTNPTETPMIVRLRFAEALWQRGFGPSSPTPSWTIPPRRTIHLPDVFENGIDSDLSTFGTLLVESSGTARPTVRARTYDSARGVGQELPILAVGELAALVATRHRLHGLGGPTPSRTNLGLVNLAEADATISIRTVDPTGAPVGQPVGIVVPPKTFIQLNRIDESAGVPPLSWFDLVADADQPLFVYASRIDLGSGDPLLVTEAPPRATSWLSGLSGSPGGAPSRWASRLSISNPGTAPASVALEFRGASDLPGGSVPLEARLVLAAGETRSWEDLLPELLGGGSAVGTLKITTALETPITAWGATELLREGAGRRGQLIPAFGANDLAPSAGALLPGLAEEGARRTNVGIFNAAPRPVDVTLTLLSAAGDKLGERSWTLGGGETRFLRRTLAEIAPSAPLSNALLQVAASEPWAILPWASVVENGSGDARFVIGSSVPAAPVSATRPGADR
jgi:hypothetical protein